MLNDRSNCAPPSANAFFPPLLHDSERIKAFRRVVRAHPVMVWANARSLGDDLEQLALLEIANILRSYNPNLGTTPEQYVGIALRTRLFSCQRALTSAYGDPSVGQGDESGDVADHEQKEDMEREATGHVDCTFNTYADKQLARHLKLGIAQLPHRKRQVIEMTLEDSTEREIAQELAVSVQSVNKSKQGAIKVLTKWFAATVH